MKPVLWCLMAVLCVPGGGVWATDFIAPSNCDGVTPTGGASGELATDGDPPVVEIYIPRVKAAPVPADIVDIVRGNNGEWYLYVNAPQTGQYYIQTVYTPFLQTFQTIHLLTGNSGYIELARPTNGTPGHPTRPALGVSVGASGAGGFIEFSASIRANEPFTMALDGNGNVVVYCVATNLNGYPVTVYDANHVFVGTGTVSNSGVISWDSTDAQ